MPPPAKKLNRNSLYGGCTISRLHRQTHIVYYAPLRRNIHLRETRIDRANTVTTFGLAQLHVVVRNPLMPFLAGFDFRTACAPGADRTGSACQLTVATHPCSCSATPSRAHHRTSDDNSQTRPPSSRFFFALARLTSA